MLPPLDIIGRPISVGDYVVFSNSIYIVHALGRTGGRYATIRIMLESPSKTTRPQNKQSGLMCLIPGEDVTAWKLKGDQ